MSEWTKNGGAAFPIPKEWDEPGMSLRDYFAAKSMAAYIASPGMCGEVARDNADKVAEWAYINADAMLKARTQR